MEINLSDTEKQALLALRKKQVQWPAMRWVLVGLGVLNILNGASSYLRHHDEAFGLLAGTVGVAVLTLAISQWNGNAARTLLLKLFEKQQ